MKKKMQSKPKALKGALKQVDTLAEKKTMGNPGGGKRMKMAREKRLEKASM
jgi:hypothetical protein